MSKTYLNKGVLVNSLPGMKADYEFASPKDFFSMPANLIPGISGVSGGRILLGSKASLQAIALTARQAPLVQSVSRKGTTSFAHTVGKELLTILSDTAGQVTEVTNHYITVKDGAGEEHKYDIYHFYNLGRKSFLTHLVKVKVGDRVKKEDILATSNYTDEHGVLAMGTNLTTAVMPYRSGNFEDAFVVTESGAKKLEAEQMLKYRIEKRLGVEVDKHKYISLFPNKYYNNQLSKIDADGVIKVGEILHYGDPVLLALSPKSLKSVDIQLGKLSKGLKNAFNDNSQTWDLNHAGEVVDVSKYGALITVNIKTVRGLAVGDKVSNGFGAKGVVGAIISDSQSPTTADGKPVDIILNSMSIASRVAPALAVNIGLGKLANKLGHPVTMAQFTEKPSVAETIKVLKKHDISETEELYDPVTGRKLTALVGPLYYTRLTHIAEDKESYRGQGVAYNWDMQPTKTEEESSKRIGNLSTAALLSHGAKKVLEDIAVIKATKNDLWWSRLKLGLPAPSPTVPFIFNKFVASLQGAGVNVTKKGNVFKILPETNADIEKLSAGPIANPLTFKVKNNNLIPEKGGLFDPTLTGVMGDRFNHIDLHMSLPNPISEDYLRKLLEVTKVKYIDLITSGEIITKLAAIDIDKKIAEYKQYLKTGKKSTRDDSVKLLSFLLTLKNNNIKLKDLILNKIPVLPAAFRPIAIQGDTTLPSPVNLLYKDLMLTNNALKDSTHIPEPLKLKLKSELYQTVKAVYGLADPITTKHKEKGIRGLLSTTLGVHGGSAKVTMFQAKVVNKPVDLVSRAVLTPDTKLDLDEASVPQEVLWKTFSPFVIRRLVQRGVPATQALLYVQARNPMAIQALLEELKIRPGIISRDPSLHKYNLTGFYLKPNSDPKDKTLKLNPLVFKSLSADNDGDQLNINIPASDEARQEVMDKMLPSKNLLSPKNFAPIYVPSNEAALGLFESSIRDNKNTPRKFATKDDVRRAFDKGELDVGDRVEIG